MRAPQPTVWILGLPVKFVVKKELPEDGEYYQGEFDKFARSITMVCNTASRKAVFMHEASHAAIWQMLKGGLLSDSILEELACNLAYAVYESVTQDPRNARLLQWLKGK